ncbi:MAG TPA: GNAT family N-acetyltransferase [Beijerinckiaceae bacterium]|jgi:GNAT superfamily N-acetyltransferase
MPMQISIADRSSDPAVLARLFSRNISADYISHSELQGRRAPAPGAWAQDVESVFRDEIAARLGEPLDRFPPDRDWKGIIEARRDGALIGMAFVSFTRDAPVPFGWLEDIVVEQALRGEGHGERMIEWIAERFREAGIRRLFLESGIGNDAAHHLFERLGFKAVSIVMMRDL